ncbi:YhgE/Pip domain-containing protein [Amphibacillus cookii]|uniref:YhgE/Pip domain-containing protein n=1 Tax=Amphibacillus cookii TaxID=767787 RepID=UPI00195DF315|nr:YhgE/Pip domain-containing protein [Amphibacillus cookii]MBM7542786.1 putative membrane protein [Amphibacillus cookii]
MKKSNFLLEWQQILTNKKVFIPIIAVTFIPLLYSGMFLWSFWDPYDHMEDLPVAIINQDKGANYAEVEMNLGEDLVDKLKDNDEFQFEFVTQEEGYQGLENRKYYMVIEIPTDFSENATTLMDEKPKKLVLKYIPNESYNFLSSQIGETAVKEIKAGISKELSSTYAETMFSTVFQLGDGLVKASDGSAEINSGAEKLAEGSIELKENLEVLVAGSIEFEDGVTKVRSGSNAFAGGSQELADGINQLSNGSDQLYAGSIDVQNGAEALSDGTSQVSEGLAEITGKVPDLIAGTEQVYDGLETFQTQLPTQLAETIGDKVEASESEMNQGLAQLNQGINSSLQDELAVELSSGLSTNVADVVATQIIDIQTQQTEQLAISLIENGIPEQTVTRIISQLNEQAPTKEQVEQTIQAQLETPITTGINQGIDQVTAGIDQGFEHYQDEVNDKLSASISDIDEQIQTAVDPVFDQLTSGLQDINVGQSHLKDGLEQLAEGTNALEEGASQLNSGQFMYVNNMELFNQKLHEAQTGSTQLAIGAVQLNGGIDQLADGSARLTDGSQKLANGSTKLSDGTGDLADGTTELHDKLEEAADEVNTLKADEDTYDMMGSPVEISKQEVNPVPNYGTGFAPYFISLGLFVGALLMTIVFNLKEPAIEPRTGFSWFIGKFGVIAIAGAIQALLVDAVLLTGLGVEVQSVPLFVLVSIITSLVFMTLIQLLVTTLGNIGRFIAIIILVLQLTTSAGTFPLELIPKAIQPINYLLPMTYTVQSFKAVISSGDYTFLLKTMTILIGFTIMHMALTITYFTFKKNSSPALKEA